MTTVWNHTDDEYGERWLGLGSGDDLLRCAELWHMPEGWQGVAYHGMHVLGRIDETDLDAAKAKAESLLGGAS